jgi:hypothetical protein
MRKCPERQNAMQNKCLNKNSRKLMQREMIVLARVGSSD